LTDDETQKDRIEIAIFQKKILLFDQMVIDIHGDPRKTRPFNASINR